MTPDLFTKLKKLKVDIRSVDGRLDIKAPRGVLSEQLIDEIKSHKEEIIEFINSYKSRKEDHISIAAVPDQPDYLVSSSQRRLWLLSQMGKSNIAYNITGTYVLEGDLDRGALEAAFDRLVARHESLRTVFAGDGQGGVRQVVKGVGETGFRLQYEELGEEGDGARIRAEVEAAFGRPFDLSAGPLLSVGLYGVGPQRWVLVFVMHHIISDGWSMGVLINELFILYRAAVSGEPDGLPPLRIQYRDYAAWQQERLKGEGMEGQRGYWLRQLGGELPVLELAGDRPRPAVKTYSGGAVVRVIGRELLGAFRSVGLGQGTTLFMELLAAVNVLLYRYTGQEEILIGTPVAGREHADLEGQIGFYLNTLVLRTRVRGRGSFGEVLEEVRRVAMEGYAHQQYPFDELVEGLGLKRDLSRSAVFDVMVVLQNTGIGGEGQGSGDLRVKEYAVGEHAVSKFDLLFEFAENEEGLGVSLEYNSDVYDRETIERMSEHLEVLVGSIVGEPGVEIGKLDYLGEKERERVREGFNGTETGYSSERTLAELFEEQVRGWGEEVALVHRGKGWSYGELNGWSNRLGGYLRERYGIGAGDVVGIRLERSEWMIVSLLGVLKSGGAYMPIDPGYPGERQAYMIGDSGCKVVLDEGELERFRLEAGGYSGENGGGAAVAGDLAYVLYTSGSTGEPKGCMLEHRGVVNRIEWMYRHYGFSREDVVLQKTTITFDVSVWEVFLPLCCGCRMVLCEGEDIGSPERIAGLIVREGVSCVHFVPGMLQAFMGTLFGREGIGEELKSLRLVITSGEALGAGTVDSWYGRVGIPLHNLYGPTEASVDVSYYATRKGERVIPIGRPIWNTRMYIVDREGGLCGVGVMGEICVGGVGLARGYLNKPELTAEKFVVCPYREGERMYRTGDLGRWRGDGNIEYLGRRDEQVKVRGYRIELGEVEAALERHPGVETAVVTAWDRGGGEKELVAYVVSRGALNKLDIRNWLGRSLPGYMIPGQYIQMVQLLRTASGKVDRKQLPSPEGLGMRMDVEYVAPRDEMEKAVVAVYEEVLKREAVGIRDDFFVLGGDSIKSIQVASRLIKRGYSLTIQDILLHPVIEELVAKVKDRVAGDGRGMPEEAAERVETAEAVEAAGAQEPEPSGFTYKGLTTAQLQKLNQMS